MVRDVLGRLIERFARSRSVARHLGDGRMHFEKLARISLELKESRYSRLDSIRRKVAMKNQVIHCHLIASVLAADGMIGPGERELLNRVMERMGLSAEEKDSVMHFEGTEDAIARGRELPEDERQAIVDGLLEAALVDGKLSPHETAMVGKITEALELS